MAALIRCDLIHRHAMHQARHVLVEVGAALECFDQRLVAGQMRHDAQLHLRVIAAHQRFEAFTGHERRADLAPGRVAVWNVLQVGVHGTQPAGGRHRLFERGVDALVGRIGGVDERGDDLLELVGLAMPEQRPEEPAGALVVGIGEVEFLQRVGVGGVAARLGAFRGLETHVFEQHLAELLGALQIHGGAGIVPGDLLRLPRVGGEGVTHGGKTLHIDFRALRLHAV